MAIPWLNIRAGLDTLCLEEHYQALSSLDNLPRPEAQHPQMIMLIGNGEKTQTVQKLRFGVTQRRHDTGDIYLSADGDFVDTSSPVFYADCGLHSTACFPKIISGPGPCGVITRPLAWQKNIPQCAEPVYFANLVYSNLMLSFSTVICFFVKDLGALSNTAKTLASWLVNLHDKAPSIPKQTRPRIMILITDPEHSDEELAERDFKQLLCHEIEMRYGLLGGKSGRITKSRFEHVLSFAFSKIEVVLLPSIGMPYRLWKPIRSRIIGASENSHIQRRASQVAFSATHFKALFHLASDHFCNDIINPFNFIKASREFNPVPLDMTQHITTFIKLLDWTQTFTFAIPTIAATFILDAFPPGMHLFDPAAVFSQHYQSICQVISSQFNVSGDQVVQIINALEQQFCTTVSDISEGRTTAVASHQEVFFHSRDTWSRLFSNTTCFACLARKPENALRCGHSLCDCCIRIHGSQLAASMQTWSVRNCPLCNVGIHDNVRIKPPTAGVRVLSIDGGGVRGISPIIWLKKLQSFLRLPMNIQDHFDIAVGTSSGGLIVLGLFLNNWSLEQCDMQFQDLASVAFGNRLPFYIPLVSKFVRTTRDFLFSFLTDSRYGSRGVNKAVKEAYGDSSSLWGSPLSTKIAITATTTHDSSTIIFCNYNGVDRPDACGYKVFRPQENRELFTWEVARATSAAPPFFTSYKGFHDGGLGGHNNPVKLALWEQNWIWNRGGKQPDFILSIGTGSKMANESPNESTLSKISQLFLPRLLRSFMMLLDGQKTWVELLNSLSQNVQPRYHRLNISFPGVEPQIDDIACIRELKQQTIKHAEASISELRRCADNMIASLFYVELDHAPVLARYTFHCKARVLCRLDAGTRALYALAVRLQESQARFYLRGQEFVPCITKETFKLVCEGGLFSTPIALEVPSMSDVLDIKIDGITQRARSISNCPYIISDLVHDQELHCVFGRQDHKRRMHFNEPDAKRRKVR